MSAFQLTVDKCNASRNRSAYFAIFLWGIYKKRNDVLMDDNDCTTYTNFSDLPLASYDSILATAEFSRLSICF